VALRHDPFAGLYAGMGLGLPAGRLPLWITLGANVLAKWLIVMPLVFSG